MKLEVYGNKTRLPGPFEHIGVPIVIYAMDKGAVHCKKQHDYRTRNCGTCGEPVAARHVFMGFVEGKAATKDCDNLDEALRVAKLYVDANYGDESGESDGNMVGFNPAVNGGAAVRDLEKIADLGWAAHAQKLIREDEEATKRAAPPAAKKT